MGHGVKLGSSITSVHLFLEDKMKAVEKKSMGEEEEKNDLGESSSSSDARSSEKPRTNEGN